MANSDEPLRDLSDRAFRQALEHPLNLRAFLKRAVPAIAEKLDYEHMRVIDRDLPFDDWRNRECDVLVELPYQTSPTSEAVLVCVLIEHQSRTDWRMPFRTLLYTVLYWDRQLKAWEARTGEKSTFRLTPVIPIVLYVAPRPWGSARTIADLIAGPEEIRVFSPRWEPLFWELSKAGSGELQNSREVFDQFLAVVRSETDLADEAEPVLKFAFDRIREKVEKHHVYAQDMYRLLLTWVMTRRPASERERWLKLAEDSVADAEQKKEIVTMGKTIAEDIFERGQASASVAMARKLLLRSARRRLGEPSSEQANQLAEMTDVSRLESLFDRAMDVSSWDELLAS